MTSYLFVLEYFILGIIVVGFIGIILVNFDKIKSFFKMVGEQK
jgi:hypothetical protein